MATKEKVPSQFTINSIINILKPPKTRFKSSIGIKYPTNRDHPLHTGYQYLEGKRADDGADGLWRIHDDLYDFTEFVNKHPGGRDWLMLTKGTDITEAFECHHLSQLPQEMLSHYHIKKATSPRNYPFTFEENDFYKTLKTRIYKELQKLPQKPSIRSGIITDLLFFGYVSLSLLATYYQSYFVAMLAGVALSMMAIAAHNFFHQKDNFRMYYFDLTMLQSRNWRISHALSHHIYTNTINDMEISSVEPFLQYLPQPKWFILRYFSLLYSPLLYCLIFIGSYIKSLIQILINKEGFRITLLIPFTVPILVMVITKISILVCLKMFLCIVLAGSLHFGVVGVNAAHHHPDIFHDGDKARPKEEMDWGIFQLDAVMDRKDINGSHFLVLTNFGDHAIHHLFPTIDHGYLEYLYPVFLETCKEFGVEHKVSSQLELVKGQYRQLIKDKGAENPPKPILKKKSS